MEVLSEESTERGLESLSATMTGSSSDETTALATEAGSELRKVRETVTAWG